MLQQLRSDLTMTKRYPWVARSLMALLCLPACSVATYQAASRPGLVAATASRGPWRTLQLHTHSKLGGGNHTIAELVAMAADQGVDAIVISEHNDWRHL